MDAFFRQFPQAAEFLTLLRRCSVSAFAAQAVYFLFLALFPFALFFLTLLQYLPITQTQLLQGVLRLFPAASESAVVEIWREAERQAAGAALSVSALVALWSSSKGMLGLMRGLNAVCGIAETRGYFRQRLIATFYTLGFALLTAGTLGFLVYGGRWLGPLWERLSPAGPGRWVFGSLRTLLGFVVFVLFFVCLYRVLPDRRSTLRAQLPGAMLAAWGWLVFSALFAVYAHHSPGLSVYGSLTSLVVFMLWLYFCMYILLAGAGVNRILEQADKNSGK